MFRESSDKSSAHSPRVLLVPEEPLCTGFRLLPILRRAGFAVDVLCLNDNLVSYSRYASRVIRKENAEAHFRELTTILSGRHPWQAVIITDELIVQRLFASDDSSLLKRWQPAAGDPLVRAFFYGKFGLEKAREAWGLPIPKGRVCANGPEIVAFGHEAGWPVIIKPPAGGSGDGVVKFDGARDLMDFRSKIDFPVLAQKYLQGRVGVTEMVCAKGRVLAWTNSYITRTKNGPFGSSTARLFQELPAVKPLAERIASLTGFEGFCGFDWIEEASSGRYYLIDFHARATHGIRFGKYCGVNFSQAVAEWLGCGVDERRQQSIGAHTNVAAAAFTVDLLGCLRRRDWNGLKAWLPGNGVRHDIFWDDPLLLLAWACRRMRAQVGRHGKHQTPRSNHQRSSHNQTPIKRVESCGG